MELSRHLQQQHCIYWSINLGPSFSISDLGLFLAQQQILAHVPLSPMWRTWFLAFFWLTHTAAEPLGSENGRRTCMCFPASQINNFFFS